jgi:serine O-acetyltransferase
MTFIFKIELIKRLISKILSKVIIYKIIFNFDGDFWRIKAAIETMKNGATRDKYLKAYHEILSRNGSWIGVRSQFDAKPDFPHGVKGIFISHGVKIGKDCIIFQQVTIGSNRLLDSKGVGAPIIGDNCYIGAGAKIIGNVKIGNNCRIGANCVVFKDMPDNSVAVLQPPRIIQKNNINNKSRYPLKYL